MGQEQDRTGMGSFGWITCTVLLFIQFSDNNPNIVYLDDILSILDHLCTVDPKTCEACASQ